EPTIDSHIVRLQASRADVFLNVSTPKFAAQAIKKIAALGWKPLHIMNNAAASVGATLRPAGLDNSQGIISAASLMDPTDPQWTNHPNMKEWVAFIDEYDPSADKTDVNIVFGYNIARTLVEVLSQCGDDLTRSNIMKQAANLKDFNPGTLLPGIVINTSPTDF